MAITQAMCTSFKKELLEGGHNFKTSEAKYFDRKTDILYGVIH